MDHVSLPNRKKPAAPDVRPFFDVEIKNVLYVHQAIAGGDLPAGVASISIDAIRRWAHDNLQQDVIAYGIEFKKHIGTEQIIKR